MAAACLNSGMAAWKTVMWEGELRPGQTVLVLGATGTSGRIAAQLAVRHGAPAVVAGRNQRVLDQLVTRGAAAAIRIDGDHDEVVAAIAAEGPYDLVVDYLWGAPAEAVFGALIRGPFARRTRYIQVGVGAGEEARLPAMTLGAAPVGPFGSGTGAPASLDASAAVYHDLLERISNGEILLDVDVVPLADVEHVWQRTGSDRRVVFIP